LLGNDFVIAIKVYRWAFGFVACFGNTQELVLCLVLTGTTGDHFIIDLSSAGITVNIIFVGSLAW